MSAPPAAATASHAQLPAWPLPSALLPLVCHFLQLRQLLVCSTVSRSIRAVLCPDHRAAAAHARPAAAAVAECWRYVPAVQLRWGNKNPYLLGSEQQATLQLDGAKLASVTAEVAAALSGPLVMSTSQQLPTIADAFAGVSLSHPSLTSQLPLASSHADTPYPLIPSLASMLRSLRFIRRLQYTHSTDDPSVLLTVLTVLPSFPSLHHLVLQNEIYRQHNVAQPPTVEQDSELSRRSALLNGVFDCLLSLPSLSSLELHGNWLSTVRQPARMDATLIELLGKRLLHATLPGRFLSDWENRQTETANRQYRQYMWQTRTNAQRHAPALTPSVSFGWHALVGQARDDEHVAHQAQYTALQSLHLDGEGMSISRLMQLFPSLVLLHIHRSRSEAAHPPSSAWPQREEVPDADDGGESASSASSAGPALRFLSTSAHHGGLYETGVIEQLHFLHSLCLYVNPLQTGLESLAPLAALASLTQLRELTLEVWAGSCRRGFNELQDEEVWDLRWLDALTRLRYLHIKALRHMSRATLHALGLLPAPPSYSLSSHAPPSFLSHSLPAFVGRVEQLGLDVFCQKVAVQQAGEFVFEGWTRLQRCAVQYMDVRPAMSSWHQETRLISDECKAANVVLRERIGAARCVSEEQLVSGRWDMRWRQANASRL